MASKSACPPRKWNSDSRKWKAKLKQLANMLDDEVTQVGNFTFVPERKFQIAPSGQTEVFLGLWHDGTELAIKKMPLSQFSDVEITLRELVKYEFHSQNIVPYIDTAKDGDFGYVALQLCEDNLEKHKRALQSIGDPKSKVQEFLTGLRDLHEKKVIHGNIKPQNVLFDSAGKTRLADFGNLNEADWMSTEVLSKPGNMPNLSGDVQVAGMLFYYMLSGGKHPFGNASRRNANILVGRYTLEGIDVEARDLIESMINSDPEERPKISQVLQHPYFWDHDKKETYLNRVGRVPDVDEYKNPTTDQMTKLMTLTEGKTISQWKSLGMSPDGLDDMKETWLSLVEKHAKDDVEYPENLLCLLHFIKSHRRKKDMKKIDVGKLFPDLIVTVYKYGKEREWDMTSLMGASPPVRTRRAALRTPSQSGQDFFSTCSGELETRLPQVLTPILIQLQNKRVLNNLEREEVESKSNRVERNRVLKSMIDRKGTRARRVFHEVLKENDPYLVEDLESQMSSVAL